MVATHHGFNVLKIPGANGTITMRCNEKDALRSMEHVYREVATMFPADEDLLEHFGDLMRKKQLVSQERATVKKASLEPHLPGSIGKKFAASASPTPSEDLVHPILDMSIGEAAVPSGRRPQFTQERSATKKVPLQAGGCKNFVTIGAGLSPK
jgi:histone deacetylase complex regulatory component SIN3